MNNSPKQVVKERFFKIDFLRGLAIIVMIYLHTSAFYLQEKSTYFFWNYLHMAVPTFVFCSGFVLFRKYSSMFSLKETLIFYKSRFIRLLKPYYIFILFYFLILFIQHHGLTWIQIRDAIFLLKEPDISWLVTLFLFLTICFPLIINAHKKSPFIIHIITFISLLSSILLIFWQPNTDYRFYMVIPWLLPFLVGIYYPSIEKKTWLRIGLPVFFGAAYIVQAVLLGKSGHDLTLQYNKYPPNFLYLSYGMFWLFFLDIILDWKGLGNKVMRNIVDFYSKRSYEIFFVHYLILHATFRLFVYKVIPESPFTSATLFWYIFLSTSIVVWLLHYFLSILKKAN